MNLLKRILKLCTGIPKRKYSLFNKGYSGSTNSKVPRKLHNIQSGRIKIRS